jgi:hypothetical protein
MLKFESILSEKKIMTKKEDPCWDDYHMVGMKDKDGREVPNCVPDNPKESIIKITSQDILEALISKTISIEEAQFFLMEEAQSQFDLIESVVEELALLYDLDSEYIWEELEQVTDQDLLEYAVDAKGHKSSKGGLTQKGRDAENKKSGSHLQAPVTTPPSKLKPGSKAAKRRKSFCARMGGVKGPMKKPNGEPTRKALALKRWNC